MHDNNPILEKAQTFIRPSTEHSSQKDKLQAIVKTPKNGRHESDVKNRHINQNLLA